MILIIIINEQRHLNERHDFSISFISMTKSLENFSTHWHFISLIKKSINFSDQIIHAKDDLQKKIDRK
jgi:hypothetical protein